MNMMQVIFGIYNGIYWAIFQTDILLFGSVKVFEIVYGPKKNAKVPFNTTKSNQNSQRGYRVTFRDIYPVEVRTRKNQAQLGVPHSRI